MIANQQERRTPRGHVHAEAFCLMHYKCSGCQHHEVFWNSRDGVTPFCTACPSCGNATLSHAFFGSDRYAPDHKPHHGQRIWVSMTKERALKIASLRVLSRKQPGADTDIVIEQVADGIYMDGQSPDLQINGYTVAA